MDNQSDTAQDLHILAIAETAEAAREKAARLQALTGCAVSAADALSPLQPCDAIVVDVSQLRLAPFSGLQAQRRQGNTAPAILCAPRLTGEMAAEVFDLDVRRFIRKPVTDEELRTELEPFLQGIRHERERAARERGLEAAQKALQRRVEQLEALTRIGRAIAGSPDESTALARTVEAATYLLRADESLLYLYPGEGRGLELKAWHGIAEEDIGVLWHPSEDSIMAEVLETGTPVLRQDSGVDSKVTTGLFVQAALAAPLVVHRGVAGVLLVQRREGRLFDGADIAAVLSLASYTGITLERLRERAELEARVEEALAASRLVCAHVDTLAGPIGGVESNVLALLDGEFGPLDEAQQNAAHRIRLAAERLQEISHLIQDVMTKFEPSSPPDG